MATPSKPPENHKPAPHQAPPAPAKHEEPPKPAKHEEPHRPEVHKGAIRAAPRAADPYPIASDAAALYKNGHRIAKQGDPIDKWMSMGTLGDGTPVHQVPLTPEIEAEIKSGSYYLAEGLTGDDAPPLGPPVVVDKPYVGGAATVGSTLDCTQGNWTNTPTNKTYQWLRGGTPIADATSAGYLLVADDVGAMMSCEVTAINAAGQASSTSNEVGPVVGPTRR